MCLLKLVGCCPEKSLHLLCYFDLLNREVIAVEINEIAPYAVCKVLLLL